MGGAPAAARRLGWRGLAIAAIGVSLSSVHIYTSFTFFFDPYIQRSIHLALVAVLILLVYPLRKSMQTVDLVLALAVVGIVGYVIFNFSGFRTHAGLPYGIEPWLGASLILVILEITRRTCGLALPTVAILSLIYALFGSNLPGDLSFPDLSGARVFAYQFTTLSGIWGIALGASATLIAMFVIFGSFLTKVGVMDAFIKLAFGIAGRLRGGPGLVAVIASGAVGMITGSSAANVYITGQQTIPLMKQYGFKPELAAAIEAAASTGGIIMPPIMGAAAFLMAELLDVSYLTIVKSAVISAFIYFIIIGLSVRLHAAKLGIKPIPSDVKLPSVKQTLLHLGYRFIPILVMLAILIIGFSAVKAAVYGIGVAFVLSMVSGETRLGPRRLIEALVGGAKGMLVIASACACAGIILGSIAMTGLGVKLGLIIVSLGDNNFVLALLLTMVVSIILGMGLPATAAYIIAAGTATLALKLLGIEPLAANMFVFYFACFAVLTPPVCITVYAAASLTGCHWMRILPNVSRLAFPAFLLPYMFIFNNGILMQGSWSHILLATLFALAAMSMFAFAFQRWFMGHLPWISTILCIVGAALLIPGIIFPYTIIGLGLGAIVALSQWRRSRHRKEVIDRENRFL
ncbi:hypothetical protein ES703_69105 [subsurface metagenome]